MLFWARAGAVIGLFFHTLIRFHRSRRVFYENERGRAWLYDCADCPSVLVTICRAAPGDQITGEWKAREDANQKTETDQKEEKEPFSGHYKRRDETLH